MPFRCSDIPLPLPTGGAGRSERCHRISARVKYKPSSVVLPVLFSSVIEVPLKSVVTFLADIHQIVMVQRYFRLVYIAAVKVYFVVNNMARTLPAYFAQTAVLVYPLGDERTAAASPFFGIVKLFCKFFHSSPAAQKPPC